MRQFFLILTAVVILTTVVHGQTDSTDYYIKRLHKWDYMKDCFAMSMDSAQEYLWKKGKPIAKKLLPLLDSTDYAVTAHTLLTLIYDGKYTPKTNYLQRTDTLIIYSVSFNGLEWTTTLHYSKDKPGTVNRKFDNNSYEKTKEMWRKRVGQ